MAGGASTKHVRHLGTRCCNAPKSKMAAVLAATAVVVVITITAQLSGLGNLADPCIAILPPRRRRGGGVLAAAAAAAWDERHGRIPTASLADQCCAGKGAWWAVNIAGG